MDPPKWVIVQREPRVSNNASHAKCIDSVLPGGIYDSVPLLTDGAVMKWTGLYLIGYVIFIAGVLMALWKEGVLASVGAFWTGVGVVIAIGLGIMFAVANSGVKENIQIDKG